MQNLLSPCNGLPSVAEVGVKGAVAPERRFVVVEGIVKIVDARRSTATRREFVGAVLLADANMKRNLEVNDLETSETRVEEKTRGRKMMEENGRRVPLYLFHISGPAPRCFYRS
jgi:hypothetical protein